MTTHKEVDDSFHPGFADLTPRSHDFSSLNSSPQIVDLTQRSQWTLLSRGLLLSSLASHQITNLEEVNLQRKSLTLIEIKAFKHHLPTLSPLLHIPYTPWLQTLRTLLAMRSSQTLKWRWEPLDATRGLSKIKLSLASRAPVVKRRELHSKGHHMQNTTNVGHVYILNKEFEKMMTTMELMAKEMSDLKRDHPNSQKNKRRRTLRVATHTPLRAKVNPMKESPKTFPLD